MNPIILSIVIPTKNRHIYLKSFIKTFISFNDDSIELVIQDNSDENREFKEYINNLPCDNIKYFYTKEPISVSENCDLAVKNSKGEYVCMIGDDDSVSSYIIPITYYLKENKIDCATFRNPKYVWNNDTSIINNEDNLIIYNCDGSMREVNLESEISKILNNCGRTLGLLPKLYYGIVIREELLNMYNRAGSFFPGPSPDMANAVTLAFVLKKCIYLDLPIMIGGVSSSSTWGSAIKKKHKGELKQVKHLPKNIEDEWESFIPKIWTVQTIWFISAVKAMRSLGMDERIKDFKYDKFASDFFCYNFEYRNMLLPHLKGDLFLVIKFIINVVGTTCFRVARFFKKKTMSRIRVKSKKQKLFKDIKTTYEASKKVDEYIEENIGNWKLDFLKK